MATVTLTATATNQFRFDSGGSTLVADSNCRSAVFEVLPNRQYALTKNGGNLWYVCETQATPAAGVSIQNASPVISGDASTTYTTSGTAKYLVCFVSNGKVEATVTAECGDTANFVMEDAGTLCILSGRTYTKVNAGLAIVGIYVHNGQYTGPLIVSETANAVIYSATSGGPWSYSTTITHGGKTWYVNNTEHFYGGDPEDTSGLDRYKCSAATPAAAAEELLTAYEATLPYYPTAGQIADYTGTEFHQIGKLYLANGTTFDQISKVYCRDGTTNSLIYSSEFVLYENGVTNTDAVGTSWDLSKKTSSTSKITFQENNIYFFSNHNPTADAASTWSRAVMWTRNKINLNGYTTLNMQCDPDPNGAAFGQAWIFATSDTIPGGDNPQNKGIPKIEGTTAGVLTLDVSNLTGEHYLGFMNTPNGSWYYSGCMYVPKIWLE